MFRTARRIAALAVIAAALPAASAAASSSPPATPSLPIAAPAPQPSFLKITLSDVLISSAQPTDTRDQPTLGLSVEIPDPAALLVPAIQTIREAARRSQG